MIFLEKGIQAPHFEGIDQNGNQVKLSDFKGKKLILYFYPKDSTPGCTAEACSLRDDYSDLTQLGLAVVGISADSQKSHLNFSNKFQLPFSLIADTEKIILKTYRAWGEKKMYGKTYEGIIRVTYIIDEKGFIEEVVEKVDTKKHAAQIQKLLKK